MGSLAQLAKERTKMTKTNCIRSSVPIHPHHQDNLVCMKHGYHVWYVLFANIYHKNEPNVGKYAVNIYLDPMSDNVIHQ